MSATEEEVDVRPLRFERNGVAIEALQVTDSPALRAVLNWMFANGGVYHKLWRFDNDCVFRLWNGRDWESVTWDDWVVKDEGRFYRVPSDDFARDCQAI